MSSKPLFFRQDSRSNGFGSYSSPSTPLTPHHTSVARRGGTAQANNTNFGSPFRQNSGGCGYVSGRGGHIATTPRGGSNQLNNQGSGNTSRRLFAESQDKKSVVDTNTTLNKEWDELDDEEVQHQAQLSKPSKEVTQVSQPMPNVRPLSSPVPYGFSSLRERKVLTDVPTSESGAQTSSADASAATAPRLTISCSNGAKFECEIPEDFLRSGTPKNINLTLTPPSPAEKPKIDEPEKDPKQKSAEDYYQKLDSDLQVALKLVNDVIQAVGPIQALLKEKTNALVDVKQRIETTVAQHAIRGEIQNQRKRTNIFEEWITQREPKHLRTSSTNSACQKTSKNDNDDKEPRRHSVPGHAHQQNEDVARSTVVSRRQRFFNRIRRQ